MFSQIVSLLYNTVEKIFAFTGRIYGAYGLNLFSILLTLALVCAVFRYILRPFIGGSLSDSASGTKKKVNKNNANNS